MSSVFESNYDDDDNDAEETNRIQVSLYVAFNVYLILFNIINVIFLSSSNSFFVYDISQSQVNDSSFSSFFTFADLIH